MPSHFTEPCQGDVIATELSGQQGGSSGAKECLDIPCGYSGPATKVDPYSLVGGRLGSVTMLSSPATFSDQFRNKRVSPGWVVSPPQDSRLGAATSQHTDVLGSLFVWNLPWRPARLG